ncbi:enoyl-CoA hydratase/isomerase [Coprinopsis cinerea AmutBmut pab1-1]|nr:enoyl-CoA hydratase/isomerase [Coprinopsis cinerea AmutBmut pab1-1]
MAPLPDYDALNKRLTATLVTLDPSGVLTILINRSKERNTYVGPLQLELIELFGLADKDDRVRVVILTAEHTAPAFCSGADISKGWDILWTPETEAEGEHAHRDGGGQLTLAILACRKITIVAINGHTAGVGTTALQLPFDFRFIWAGAKLTFPFIRRGIVPEAVSSYLLPKLIGLSRATSVLLTGGTISPTSPHVSLLYHQIVEKREDVYPEAFKLAKDLAENTSQTSVAYAKALLHHPGDSPEENHLLDSRAIRILGKSNDAKEGVQAFFERRKPKFTDTLSKNLGPWYPWWRRVDIKHVKSKL